MEASTAPGRAGNGLPCPTCRVDLVMTERQGIEIDYCPKCRGVWLDRGELDKIIERSATDNEIYKPAQVETSAAQSAYQSQPLPAQDQYHGHGGHGRGGHGHAMTHRKHGFLSRLFD